MRTNTVYAGKLIRLAAIVAVVFGAVTIREGGNVLFGDGARTAGNIVHFVLWFNFFAGFAYIAAGIGLWLRTRWSMWLALAIALGTVGIFSALGVHVAMGGAFEMRTVWAMTLRSMVWVLIALLGFSVAARDERRGVVAAGGGGNQVLRAD